MAEAMRRLEFLDSLRGLAALYVIVHHVPLIVWPALPIPDFIEPFVMYGWTGVTLFFVMSAFSLCLTMPRHMEKPTAMASYFVARIARIVPLFLVLLLWTYFSHGLYNGIWHSPIEVLANLTFTYNLLPGWGNGIVGASWTIGVEMLFYAAFPLLYLRFRDTPSRIALAVAGLLLAPLFKAWVFPFIGDEVVRTHYQQISLASHFGTFCLGMLAFSIWGSLRDSPPPLKTGIGIGLISAAAFLFAVLIRNPYIFTGVLEFYQAPALPYLCLIVGLGLFQWRPIANRHLSFLGRRSYSLYLWHPPVLYGLNPAFQWLYASGLPNPLAFVLCVLLAFAAMIFVAVLSHRYIEVPGDILVKRLAGSRAKRPAGEAAI